MLLIGKCEWIIKINHTLILHYLWPLTALDPLPPRGHASRGIHWVLQMWLVVSPAIIPFFSSQQIPIWVSSLQ